jgi:uncharacterized protein (TIGR00730 family)
MGQRSVAVFGSSEPNPGESLYEQALALGRLLGKRRFTVVTGGYGGVMEAVSRGAQEAGGATLGVTCDAFASRRPNRFLSRTVSAPDLHLRQRELINRARAFIVLAGRAGTLAELSMLWALNREGCLEGRPVILLGVCWSALLDLLSDNDMLEESQLDATHLVPTAAAAVETLVRLIGRPEEH